MISKAQLHSYRNLTDKRMTLECKLNAQIINDMPSAHSKSDLSDIVVKIFALDKLKTTIEHIYHHRLSDFQKCIFNHYIADTMTVEQIADKLEENEDTIELELDKIYDIYKKSPL